MTQLSEQQLVVMRAAMPAFKELEARRIHADENAARLLRVAQGLEPLEQEKKQS